MSPTTVPTAAKHLRVLYAEDDPVLRDLFAVKLGRLDIVRSVVPCANARDAVNAMRGSEIDIAVLDLNLGEGQINGIDLGLALRAIRADLPIVVFSQHAVPRIENVLPARERSGWAFVQKKGNLDIVRFAEVIDEVVRGQGSKPAPAEGDEGAGTPLDRLSRRQRQVMALAAAGYDAKAIAEQLSLAHVSVRRELSHAYRVLVPDPQPGTDLRTVAVLEYMRLGAGMPGGRGAL